MWKDLHDGKTGSEGGIVLADEEYEESCRITLEKCPDYYAITCGVYGAMFHTVFCDDNFQKTYNEMKRELQEFIGKNTSEEEKFDFYEHFTSRF